MNYEYPLLNKVFKHYKDDKIDLSNFCIYSCQHLLAPQYEMYKMFIKFGLNPKNIFALGKIYSSNTEIINDLREIGIQVIQPEFYGGSFDSEHKVNCEKLASEVSDNNINIILDDGGYLIDALKDKNIFFAVEQTSSGFRKLENYKIKFPIFNVARSETKLTQESPIIGRIVFERVKNYTLDNKLESPSILIVGLGPIGNSIYQIFSEEKFNVDGFDIEIERKKLLLYLENNKPDIVIGATGTQLLSESDLTMLNNDHIYHFISASSSDREFPVSNFRKNNFIHGDVKYKNFIFVNNSFPITFKGNKYEATPIEIEKTIALLMGSVLHGISRKENLGNGFVDVSKELENLINE